MRSLKEKGMVLVIPNIKDDGGTGANTYDLTPLYQKLEHTIS
jgi:hypothetical protein